MSLFRPVFRHSHFSLRLSYMRCIKTTTTPADLARLLDTEHPNEDPNFLRESKVKSLLDRLTEPTQTDTITLSQVHAKWKTLYNAKLHDTAYEEAADPGEQCDGELPSWYRERKAVEKDKEHKVPSVSAHEAATRLKERLSKVDKNDT